MFVFHTVRIESINSGSVLNPALGVGYTKCIRNRLPLAAEIFVKGYTGARLIWVWFLGPMMGGVAAWAMFDYVYYPQAKKLKMGL